FGLRRLFLGYALPTSVELYREVAPITDIEGGESIWLGQLQAFIERLAHWRKKLSRPATLREWQRRINLILAQFFQPDEQEEQIVKSVRDEMDELMEHADLAGFDGKVGNGVIHQHLSAQIGATLGTQRSLTGRVTFCGMVPMRSLPFQVVCLMGMNDRDYPRNRQPLGFDLIAKEPRKGDRSRREDDRYLFLEALLSAREVLYISYVGHSQQDNSVKLPSVVVSELLDYVEQGYGDIRDHLLTEHPLQPFSHRSYGIGSYAGEWLERSSSAEQFAAVPLPEKPKHQDTIELDELTRFFANPSRYFLERRLGIHAAEYEETLEESEIFELDNLAAYQLKSEVLEGLLAGESVDTRYPIIKARAELPHGGFGQMTFARQTGSLDDFSRKIAAYLEEKEPAREIGIELDGSEVNGRLPYLVAGGLFRYRPAKLKAKDQLVLWIEHLALCAYQVGGQSLHLAEDREFRLGPVEKEAARAHMGSLLALYREGRNSPLPLFPNSSLAYAGRIAKGKSIGEALSAARKIWVGSDYSPGEGTNPWFEQAFRGNEPLNEQFQTSAEQLFVPMLNKVEKG
ncbi:MAG: exodeoxyribonuclease V subunit gamma, partial [Gammaproteobacteria bacterium]|nr:exodeoxyribonuclease V subunit gamma [Gammaproteobacteria bacterium]